MTGVGMVFLRKIFTGGLADPAEARRALAVLADPAHGVELRALPSGAHAVRAGSDLDGLLEYAERLSGGSGLYYTLNPIPATLAHSARVGDVLSRRWLLLDIDAVRPADVSATDAEKEAAREVTCKVIDYLSARDWPASVTVDSGNGWHLLYRIDLPANDHARQLLRDVLKALSARFDTDAVRIDPAVHNASRIARLPGSWARKGVASDDRPHRPCRLLHAPPMPEVVPLELLEAEARPESAPAATPSAPRTTLRKVDTAGAYGRRALESEVGKVSLAPNGQRNHALNSAAFSLGQLVAGGVLDRGQVEEVLRVAARHCGLYDDPGCGAAGVEATLASGLTAGLALPRTPPEGNGAAPKTAEVVPEGIVIQRASSIRPRKVEWLWPLRVPLGKMTTFAGVGGLGKTFVLLDMAARISRGDAWPDTAGECCERGQVLYISGEDDPDDTLVPRLIESGADLSRVSFLTAEALDHFTLAALKLLTAAIGQIGRDTRMVVIDPPSSYLAGTDDHKNAELRALLSPLKAWASAQRVAIVFNTHVNKAQGKVDAMMRVMGSVAWVNAVRAAHLFARDPEQPDRRLFVPMKTNLGPDTRGLAYRLQKTDALARVEWLGDVDMTADQAVNHTPARSRKLVASEWLIEQFREQREWPSDDLFRAAREAGISRSAVFEAKESLTLPRARKRTAEDGSHTWVWWVPQDWDRLKTDDDTPTAADTPFPAGN